MKISKGKLRNFSLLFWVYYIILYVKWIYFYFTQNYACHCSICFFPHSFNFSVQFSCDGKLFKVYSLMIDIDVLMCLTDLLFKKHN